jgi:calcium-dependent protein kinase
VFKNNYNEKADIWSIGIIFYTLICGHPPFRGRREDIIKIKILNYNISFPSNNFRNMSQSGINLLKKLLEPDYNKRISAEEALNDEWFVKMENKVDDEIEINNLGNSICKNLEQFKNTVCLQKLILSFLTNQTTFHDEIKRLKEEFDRIDENKDGEISKDELIKCLETIYPNGEAKIKANEIFNEIDFNHDGTINFSEYLTLTMEKERLINEDMLKKTFKLFDIDGNGYITIDELKETMPLELSNNSSWLELVKEVDQDGDCQISFNEFKQMMLKLSSV